MKKRLRKPFPFDEAVTEQWYLEFLQDHLIITLVTVYLNAVDSGMPSEILWLQHTANIRR